MAASTPPTSTSGEPPSAPPTRRTDANGDGTVNGADYVIWRKHFGTAAAASYVLVDSRPAVPEPTTFCLLMLGATSLVLQGYRSTLRLPPPSIS